MPEITRSWDHLTKEQRDACIAQMIAYFRDERGEILGVIAADALVDFFLQTMGTVVYNKAIEDVKKVVQAGLENVEVDIEQLIQK